MLMNEVKTFFSVYKLPSPLPSLRCQGGASQNVNDEVTLYRFHMPLGKKNSTKLLKILDNFFQNGTYELKPAYPPILQTTCN
ncbi:hypothetical protein Mapa_002258 [Marchantia paleacea]|nr:hypothetical protein Mapa_002258 [Marchantia paleacea]